MFERDWRTHDMSIKVISESHVDGLVHFRPERCRDLWNVVRSDASLQQCRVGARASHECNVDPTPRT
jgi:hypothetical protein